MISVALCTYNGSAYIEEQLYSILNQTVSVDQIVVCDDNSDDNTLEKIINIADTSEINFIVKVNKKRMGVTNNFSRALALCDGDIIFLSDQDDIWVPHKVERILLQFNFCRDNLLIFSDAYLVDTEGRRMHDTLWQKLKFTPDIHYSIQDHLRKRFVTGATVAIRKKLLKESLPIPECWIHDAWLAINASLWGNIVSINEKLILYRQHAKNVIGVQNRSFFNQIRYTYNHISESIIFRTTMMNRFICFVERNRDVLSKSNMAEIQKCINFWTSTAKINNCKLICGIKIIIVNFVKGNYCMYNHGIYGLLIDLLILSTRKYNREN